MFRTVQSRTPADRLKRLTTSGIIKGRRYSQHPPRFEYALTAKGEDLICAP
ncbi:MAG: winged helix-turn-helix transcriptional regulator [Acidobacteriota bacterium]|nr:winged helix-turn-helix transcriptional regulator [Acidobacteriota bacterium]